MFCVLRCRLMQFANDACELHALDERGSHVIHGSFSFARSHFPHSRHVDFKDAVLSGVTVEDSCCPSSVSFERLQLGFSIESHTHCVVDLISMPQRGFDFELGVSFG